MKIAVVGTGYVGLVTGTCFAETGNNVVCVDIDKHKVENLQKGRVPIYEPHLDNLFQRNLKEGRLRFSTELADATRHAKVIFLALPTPASENGHADLSHVLKVAKDLAKLIHSYVVVVNKSTVPVGTSDKVRALISKATNTAFDVISNPEFLREGFAVDDFMKPDRIVVGSNSKRANKIMRELYAPFIRQGNPIFFMDARSAELTKYAANVFLATKISFMNEMANLSERTGANIDMIRLGIGADERIGKRFLFAGIGYGGSCFPKDVKALNAIASRHKYDFKILRAVMEVNDKQQTILVKKIKNYYGGHLKSKTFALWGLAFKPDTDDIREAAALNIARQLLKAGANVRAFDPAAMKNVGKVLKHSNLAFSSDHYSALRGADALIVATEWPIFRTPDFKKVQKLLKKPVVFDGRNLYEPELMEQLGFHYDSIGRPQLARKKM